MKLMIFTVLINITLFNLMWLYTRMLKIDRKLEFCVEYIDARCKQLEDLVKILESTEEDDENEH